MTRSVAAVTVLALAAIAGAVSYRHARDVATSHGEIGVTAYLSPLTLDGLVLVAALVSLDAARHGDRNPRLATLALALGLTATIGVNAFHGLAHGPLGALIAGWPAVALVLAIELLTGMIRRHRDRTPPPDPPRELNAPEPHHPRTPHTVDTATTTCAPAPDVPGAPAPGAPVVPDVPTPVPAPVPDGGPALAPAVSDATAEVPACVSADGTDPHLDRAAEVFAAEVRTGRVPALRRIKATLHVGQGRAAQIRAHLETLAADHRPPESRRP